MKRSKTSSSWMREHVNDFYVKSAKQQGFRSRAAFKLLEIDERDRLLAPGMTVVDLGAAPGGWSQVTAERWARAAKSSRWMSCKCSRLPEWISFAGISAKTVS